MKSKLPQLARNRTALRKPASERLDPRPNALGIFSDGSRLITDSRGLTIGLVEAQPKYAARKRMQSGD